MKHPKKERTLVILKPDTIQRSLVGDIIQRFEKVGLKLTALKMSIATEEKLLKHYKKNDEWFIEKGSKVIESLKRENETIEKQAIDYGEDVINGLIKFMTCGPVVIMVWEGNKAVSIIKKMVGGTEPITSDVGTIRGDYTLDSYKLANLDCRAVRNLVHCSDSLEEADREAKVWFDEEEILNYRIISEQILYDVNIDGIKE